MLTNRYTTPSAAPMQPHWWSATLEHLPYMPSVLGVGVAPEQDDPLAGPGGDLQVAGLAEVALDQRYRLDLAKLLAEDGWAVPGLGRVVIVAPIMGNAAVGRGATTSKLPRVPKRLWTRAGLPVTC